MFLVCVFSDIGYPDVIWGHHVGIDTVNWNRYCEVDTAHIHFGVVIFDDSDGDVEMGLSMCGRFGDWVILVMGYPGDGLSCGLGYPVTGISWDWVIQLGDGITSLIGKIGSSGGWRRLVMVTTWGIHVICWNMNEHGYFLMFSVDGVMKFTYKPSM